MSKLKAEVLTLMPESLRSTASRSEGELTLFTRADCSEVAGSGERRERRFDQVTAVWVRQDSQQVAVPRLLHHLLHLENGKFEVS